METVQWMDAIAKLKWAIILHVRRNLTTLKATLGKASGRYLASALQGDVRVSRKGPKNGKMKRNGNHEMLCRFVREEIVQRSASR